MDDTIAAIATPVGAGGLAVLRLSGRHALAVADRIFQSPHGPASGFPSHTVHYGHIVNGADRVDQVLLTILRGPHSYTREDTVEISCHGGHVTAARILGLCLEHGARLAQPGEFTRRAFLNGRLDLTQAEAVLDLIQARTERAQRAAERMLEGHLAQRIKSFRDRLVDHLAFIEAHIDFPEEDLPTLALDRLRADLQTARVEAERLLATAPEGRLLREGAAVAIIGRPNAGKSSLMNTLLGQERSIVTAVAGTTRDTVEESVSIQGIPVRLIDTAGVREARGIVEQHGVRRTSEAIKDADLVLAVVDGSRAWSAADTRVLTNCVDKNRVLVLAKADRPLRTLVPEALEGLTIIRVSSKTGIGLDALRSSIYEALKSAANILQDNELAITTRQAEDLRVATNGLTQCIVVVDGEVQFELVAQSLRRSVEALDSLTGASTKEDVLDRIFSRFCIGK